MAALDTEKPKLSGAERAAVLLLTLDEPDAAEVLKHLSPREVQKIGEAMVTMVSVPKAAVSAVLGDFCAAVDELTELGSGNQEYLCNLLNTALGEDKARSILDRILPGYHARGLGALRWVGPRAVADLIRLEHPQVIALVLSYLDQDHAADVLAALPESMRADIVMRIATLEGIQPGAIRELGDMLEKHYSCNSEHLKSTAVGGLQTAADIMKSLDTRLEVGIIQKLREIDAELGNGIEDLMFVFDDLIDVDDRDIQALLREISSETLIVALKGADEGIKDKLFRNMSRRAAEMLRDDLATRGQVRLRDVKTAQKEILTVARRMAEIGEIVLAGKGREEYI